jgi:hypothetical protein
MNSNRALLLTLMVIIGELLVSVVSYAQSSPASASNVICSISISGRSGRPIPQDIPRSADLISGALSGSRTVSLADNTGFVVGDYVRIDDGLTHDYHTVSGVSEGSISVSANPVIAAPDVHCRGRFSLSLMVELSGSG